MYHKLQARKTCSCSSLFWCYVSFSPVSHGGSQRRNQTGGRREKQSGPWFSFCLETMTGRVSVYLILPALRCRCLCKIPSSCRQISAMTHYGWEDHLLLLIFIPNAGFSSHGSRKLHENIWAHLNCLTETRRTTFDLLWLVGSVPFSSYDSEPPWVLRASCPFKIKR